jgi:hypothetical protein
LPDSAWQIKKRSYNGQGKNWASYQTPAR